MRVVGFSSLKNLKKHKGRASCLKQVVYSNLHAMLIFSLCLLVVSRIIEMYILSNIEWDHRRYSSN